ncbi:hypothetical protein TSUD_200060 [Trifolium subterraneum]|nr:hypothetical protein TSUD_200060 [Trifolium subterraneum]
MIIGDRINATVITGNQSKDDGWTTFRSATFAVDGAGFIACNISFKHTAGPAKHQAVALRSGVHHCRNNRLYLWRCQGGIPRLHNTS